MLTIVSAWALGCKGNRDESNGVATQVLYRYFHRYLDIFIDIFYGFFYGFCEGMGFSQTIFF